MKQNQRTFTEIDIEEFGNGKGKVIEGLSFKVEFINGDKKNWTAKRKEKFQEIIFESDIFNKLDKKHHAT